MTYIEGAPTLPNGYFYNLNPHGRTFGGKRETVEVCEHRSFLWFKWIKVHSSAGVYRDNLFITERLVTPEVSAAKRAFENWVWS